ncbi:MAG: zinc ribbon domain-containing protein [Hungatella sp.]|nr:zinc ribbon domain-containing protein [Hungatella sp.]
MFCEKCGNEIEKGGKFCSVCGQKVETAEGRFKGPKMTGKPAGVLSRKLILGFVLICAVVAAGIGCVKLFGQGKRMGNTLPEKLFLAPADQLANMSLDDLADMLDEEGALYEEDTYYIMTSSTDYFMGYDCIFGYGEYDNHIGAPPSGLAGKSFSFNCIVAFDSNDDFKEGQKELSNYLEKSLVKKGSPLKTKGKFFSGNTYLVECSDKGIDLFFDKFDSIDDLGFFGVDNSLVRNYAAEAGEDGQLDKTVLKELIDSMDYEMYKFVQISYPTFDEELEGMFPRDKSYTNHVCYIQVTSLPMTQDQYIAFAGTWGYDAINGKKIDLSEFEPDLDPDQFQENSMRLPWHLLWVSEDDEFIDYEDFVLSCMYFMQEHDYNLLSGEYVKNHLEKKLWYLKWFGWNIDSDEPAPDLSEYRGSVEIYMAIEDDFNCSTLVPFESETEKAVFLGERNYNVETGEWFTDPTVRDNWLLKNYGYDSFSGKFLDKEVVDGLAEYERFLNELKDNMSGVLIEGSMLYLNDDDMPECIFVDSLNAGSRAPGDSSVYILSYQNGRLIEKDMQIPIMSYQGISKSGLICVGGNQGSYFDHEARKQYSYGSYEIIELGDSFETVGVVSWDEEYDLDGNFLNGTFEVNGSPVSEEEMYRHVESFGFDTSSFDYTESIYTSYDNNTLASITKLYQDLERGEKK